MKLFNQVRSLLEYTSEKKLTDKEIERVIALAGRRGYTAHWDEEEQKFQIGSARAQSPYSYEAALKLLKEE